MKGTLLIVYRYMSWHLGVVRAGLPHALVVREYKAGNAGFWCCVCANSALLGGRLLCGEEGRAEAQARAHVKAPP